MTSLLLLLLPAASADELDDLVKAPTKPTEAKVSEGDFSILDEGEDEFADFAVEAPPPKAKPAPPPAAKVAPPPAAPASAGKAPLKDHYEARVSKAQGSAVVVELPVLIANSAADVSGNYWLIGEVWVDGSKVGETRQMVTKGTVTPDAPTMAFLKVQAPVSAQSGEVEVRVYRSADGKTTTPLFVRSAGYSL